MESQEENVVSPDTSSSSSEVEPEVASQEEAAGGEVANVATKPFISLSKKQFMIFLVAAFVTVAGIGLYKSGFVGKFISKNETPVSSTSLPSASQSATPAKGATLLSGKALFTSNRDGDSAIYQVDLKSEETKKFIKNVAGKNDSNPIVSPNKKFVVFYSDRSGEKDSYGNPKNRLYIMSTENSSIREVSDKSGVSYVTWLPSSSGFVALFGEYTTNAPYEASIVFYNASSASLETLVKNSQFEPYEANNNAYLGNVVVSSDSRRMAFTVSHYKNPAVQGVWIYNFFDGRSWRVSDKTASGVIEFSKDSQRIEFDSYIGNGKKRYRVDLDGGLEQEISLIDKGEYCYQHDGMGGGGGETVCARSDIYFGDGVRKAYVDTRDNKSDIYIANVDGSEEKRLTNTGGVQKIVFGPEEKYIIYSYSKADDSAVFLLSLENPKEPQRLTSTSSTFVEYLP